MPPSERFSPEELRSIRQKKGFSVEELALVAGVSPASIHNYESGRSTPLSPIWQRLKEALKRKRTINTNTWRRPPKDPIPTPVIFRFESGRSYSIVDSGLNAHQNETISPPTGELCLFVYKCKDGIHHVFTEVRGGWTRTYTDAQLIGKLIEEV